KANAVLLWDVEAVQQSFALGGHTAMVNTLAFSPDGTLLASAGADNTIRLWNPADGASVAVLEAHTAAVNALTFSPDGTLLASGSSDGMVILWDVAAQTHANTLQEAGSAVRVLAFSPDGALLAAAGGDDITQDYAIRIWEAESGEELASLAGHTDRVGRLAFNAEAKVPIEVSSDKSIGIWGVGS